MLQKWSYHFHSSCQNTLWTLIVLFPRFDILDNTRKLVQKFLFTGKFVLFFRNLCIQQPVRCYRNCFLTSTVFVRIPFSPYNLSPDFFWFDKATKNRPLSFHWRACFSLLKTLCFQQPFRSWRNDLVNCKMIVKTTCGSFKMLHDVFHIR